jgi:type IV secretory pathway VirD2 relaxase
MPATHPNARTYTMASRDDDLRVRPGHIRDGNRGARKSKSYVAQVMRAAKKAGHTGSRFIGGGRGGGRSTFGRGGKAARSLGLKSPSRRVVVKARVVRHKGSKFRSAPFAKHIGYLKREGVTRDGQDARMFDARSDEADAKAFAVRCEDDRHHFRFIVSPEDAPKMADLKTFTRKLMKEAEHDLGTKLDWVAVDHWNTDNPHIHVLVRGKLANGKDLVISRDYISRGFRLRAAELVGLELGPRTEQEIQSALEKDVSAERFTNFDRNLRDAADNNAGIVDLRPGAADEDPELRRLLVGRAQTLERFGLAEQIAPGQWTLKAGLEQTLRDLATRGDIIKTMHRAMSGAGREPDVTGFALHPEAPDAPIIGRLSARGLHDELNGTAYAIIEGTDGRTHHLKFSDLELTGDVPPGGIVETRTYEDENGRKRLALAVRSALSVEAQIGAPGATWIDRQLLTRDPSITNAGFGANVRAAMSARTDHLVGEGLARRQGRHVVFARDLLATLRRCELDDAAAKLAAEHGLAHQPLAEGEPVAGVYRQRLTLSSGRFAMIDDGLGFQLVPWRPALEKHLGQEVRGIATASGVEWSFGRKRGLGI